MTVAKVKGGYEVKSEKTGKNLGGPYKTKAEAEKRLQQVEYFKHHSQEHAASKAAHHAAQGKKG